MPMRVVINGREVTNPAARAVIGMWAILIAGFVGAALMFVVLPLVGIAVTLSVGLAGVALIALGLGLPVLILARIIRESRIIRRFAAVKLLQRNS